MLFWVEVWLIGCKPAPSGRCLLTMCLVLRAQNKPQQQPGCWGSLPVVYTEVLLEGVTLTVGACAEAAAVYCCPGLDGLVLRTVA